MVLMKIINTNYNISTEFNKKIILISDVHYNDKNDLNRLNYVLKNIEKIKPNFICIAGDLINKSLIKNENILIDWLIKLSSIGKVIMCIGNHEYYIDKRNNKYGLNKNLLDNISKIDNLYLLDNNSILLDNINLVGINLPIELYCEQDDKKIIDFISKIKINNKKYNVLLIHSPLNICNEAISKNFNLILCGHTHGGVVPKLFRPIFKNNGIISPNKNILPKNVYGNIKINNSNIIISSGLKVTPFKLLNIILKPEIVIIKI